MEQYLTYNGQTVRWYDGKTTTPYPASSGMIGVASVPGSFDQQSPKDQCVGESASGLTGGPIPEGVYSLNVKIASPATAKIASKDTCALVPAYGVQSLPTASRAAGTEQCEGPWRNWGDNRVRLSAHDQKARTACGKNPRGGFYLHDSKKGFTHGCVEVSGDFFERLRKFIASKPKQQRMLIKVDYTGVQRTNATGK